MRSSTIPSLRAQGGASVLSAAWRAVPSVLLWAAVAVLTIAVALLEWTWVVAAGWIDRQRRVPHAISICWGLALVALATGGRVTVHGRRYLSGQRAAVLIANHQSLVDIMALYALRRQFKWVAKSSLFRVPFLGWAMSASGYIRLERGRHGSIRNAYADAARYLAEGVSVLFFPEGTRSHTDEMLPFKNGAFKLALDTGAPVIPIVLRGTRDFLVRGSWLFRFGGRIRLTVLEPIDVSGYRPDEAARLRDDARRRIADVLHEA